MIIFFCVSILNFIYSICAVCFADETYTTHKHIQLCMHANPFGKAKIAFRKTFYA